MCARAKRHDRRVFADRFIPYRERTCAASCSRRPLVPCRGDVELQRRRTKVAPRPIQRAAGRDLTMTVKTSHRLIFFDVFQNGHISGALAELIRSTLAPTKDRLIGKIMGGNPVFRDTRVPVHMLAELVPSRACARARGGGGGGPQ